MFSSSALHLVKADAFRFQIIVGIIACRVKVQACRDEAFGLLERLVTLFEGAPDHPIPSESLVSSLDAISSLRSLTSPHSQH